MITYSCHSVSSYHVGWKHGIMRMVVAAVSHVALIALPLKSISIPVPRLLTDLLRLSEASPG